MKAVYKFIAGNSRVTPLGVAVALIAAWLMRGSAFAPEVFTGILIATLSAATFERVT